MTIDDGSGTVRAVIGPLAAEGLTLASGMIATISGPLGQRDSSGTGTAGYRIHATLAGELERGARADTEPDAHADADTNRRPDADRRADSDRDADPTAAPTATPTPDPEPDRIADAQPRRRTLTTIPLDAVRAHPGRNSGAHQRRRDRRGGPAWDALPAGDR